MKKKHIQRQKAAVEDALAGLPVQKYYFLGVPDKKGALDINQISQREHQRVTAGHFYITWAAVSEGRTAQEAGECARKGCRIKDQFRELRVNLLPDGAVA